MKRFLLFFCAVLICGVAFAQTIRWHVGDTVIETTTCESGTSITPPTAPTKYGYTFREWELGYTQIEYLESTGTQYIDTGIYPTESMGCDVGYMVSNFDSNWHSIFASRAGGDLKQFSINYRESNNFFIENTASGKNRVVFQTIPGQYQNLIFRNNIVTKPDGTSEILQTSSPFVSNYSIFIFAFNTDVGTKEYGSFKLYHLKFYDNNTLVRDFIPVLDPNGTPCLYDKVTNQFFYNAGTGQFVAGPVI